MIETRVDNAIANLLTQSVPGLTVVVGIADNDPPLQTPTAVVYSEITEVLQAFHPLYRLKTTIELYSISGNDTASDVDATLSAVDVALTTTPSPEVMAALNLGNLWLAWSAISKSQNIPGDRRTNLRELAVTAYQVAGS